MPSIIELSEQARGVFAAAMTEGVKLASSDEATPSQKMNGLKVALAAAQTVIDRTDPRLTSVHEVRTDTTELVKALAAVIGPAESERILLQVQGKLLPRKNEAGRPVEMPGLALPLGPHDG